MFLEIVRQKTALIPLSVYTFPTPFFGMFGTHVIFAEIGIMEFFFVQKSICAHQRYF